MKQKERKFHPVLEGIILIIFGVIFELSGLWGIAKLGRPILAVIGIIIGIISVRMGILTIISRK